MSHGPAYLDRAVPRLAREKFLMLKFMAGLLIEPDPGSNCPGRICWPGRSALASRFLAFCPAFAFARWRALALVMSWSPLQVSTWDFYDPLGQNANPFCGYPRAAAARPINPMPGFSPERALEAAS